MTKLHVALVLAVLILGISGCKKEAPPPAPTPVPTPAPQVQTPPPAPNVVSVANINLGKSLGPDKKVSASTDTFAKSDTIYAVVETLRCAGSSGFEKHGATHSVMPMVSMMPMPNLFSNAR